MGLPINIENILNGKTIEWDRIELKKGWNPEDILHSLCAFANDLNNWDGGYIIIGVEEENGVAKLPPIGLASNQIDTIQKKLIELSNKIIPHYFPVSQPVLIDGKHILIIWANAGDNKPYKSPVSLSKEKSEKAFYIKKGSTTVKVKDGSDDERRLLEQTARIPFDDRINHQATLNDLSLQLIQAHLREIGSTLYEESAKISFEDLCRQMKIAKGADENLKPTNAGLLMFNENPHHFFEGAKIELIIHKGKAGKDYTEKIFTGNIQQQIRDTLQFIKTNITREFVSKPENKAESVRFYNYPFQAIEEVLVNAVYHKSYERLNPVEIQIHDDKIEILSFPGPMPPVNQQILKRQRIIAREYRNRKIGSFLKELKLTEGRGTGLPIVYQELEKNGSPLPIFETDDDRTYFLCTIKIHPLAEQLKMQEEEMTQDATQVLTQDNKQKFSSIPEINKHLRLLGSSKGDEDKEQIFSLLNKLLHHLSLLVFQKRDVDLKQGDYLDYQVLYIINKWVKLYSYNRINELYSMIKPFVEKTGIDILEFCKQVRNRDDIFEKIQMYNNTKNFNRHIKPLLATEWLLQTLPDKPKSKHQQYVISEIGKIVIKNEFSQIKKTPVSSSNIASVGYDAQKQILEIEFHHGAVYQYFDVPKEVYYGLMKATSHESYFFYEIKEKYSYNKI